MSKTDNNNRNRGKELKALIRLLGYMFKLYKFQFIAVIILILLSSLSMVVGTMYTKQLIDGYITPNIGNPNIDFAPLLKIIGAMTAIYSAGIICTYLYEKFMIVAAQGTLKQLRDDVFSHMERLPIKYFDTHAHGDIMSVYSSDIDTLRNMITESLAQIISSIITVISVLISMFILDIPLTIFTLIMVVIMLSTTKSITAKSGANFKDQQENIGVVNGYIEEMLEGLKVVKVFSYEEEAKKKFDILQFTRTLNQPISQTAQQINSVTLAAAGAYRVFKVLDEKPEFDEGYVKLVDAEIDNKGNIVEVDRHTGIWAWKHPHEDGSTTYERLLGDVVFEDVDFGYNENKIILHNINLYAKPGEKIAFVGATGAGKTTITNLINRFYDIQNGKIRYDGINIQKINKSDLRKSLGIVLQDTHLFSGTVADNIRYGKLDATDEEVYAAAKLANAHHFIKHLPNGYYTYLSNGGANLSQGQRQLLSIARAAIADPPVLILDEATSSIDTRTEKIVQEGMDKLMKGRTVFVIAHRLSTIRNSDVIMVLEQGRIIERGNHDELLKQKGTYYQLYTGGFELE